MCLTILRETLSRLEKRKDKEHTILMRKAEDQDNAIKEVGSRAQEILSRQTHARDSMQSGFESLQRGLNHADGRIEDVSKETTSIQTSLISMRSIGEQLLYFIRTFPAEIRQMLQNVVATNMRTYTLLLQIQGDITRPPTMLLQDNIWFEDALGRVRELPYAWFRHWEIFEGMLQAEFRNIPGSRRVREELYDISVNSFWGTRIEKDEWSKRVFPGSKVSMSMLAAVPFRKGNRCPRPLCIGQMLISMPCYGVMRW